MPCKIFKQIDYDSDDWMKYCLWRNNGFAEFRSLDSTLRQSQFEIVTDEDWSHVVTVGNLLTDVIDDAAYARKIENRYENPVIEVFEFPTSEMNSDEIVGYDILDECLDYSLLTNFGNDIKIVNSCLTQNGLVRHWDQITKIHDWLLTNMGEDPHVVGSRIVAVQTGNLFGRRWKA